MSRVKSQLASRTPSLSLGTAVLRSCHLQDDEAFVRSIEQCLKDGKWPTAGHFPTERWSKNGFKSHWSSWMDR